MGGVRVCGEVLQLCQLTLLLLALKESGSGRSETYLLTCIHTHCIHTRVTFASDFYLLCVSSVSLSFLFYRMEMMIISALKGED